MVQLSVSPLDEIKPVSNDLDAHYDDYEDECKIMLVVTVKD